MSCFVSEPAALCAFERQRRALLIVDAKPFAIVLAEIKLGEIAVKVLAIDMLVDADQAALQDREEAFKGIGVH